MRPDRVHLCSLLVLAFTACGYKIPDGIEIPDATITFKHPRGLQASIPDTRNTTLFMFHGQLVRINETFHGMGAYTTDRCSTYDRCWIYENTGFTVRPGDVLHYSFRFGEIFFSGRKTCIFQLGTDKCVDLESSQNTTSYYSYQTIFVDNFDHFSETLWTREIKAPLSPDYEFCVFHNQNHHLNAKVENGILRLSPSILEDLYGVNATKYGKLQLSNCTSEVSKECNRQGMAFSILPPVISARFTTKDSFTFKYGKIEIRAKFPAGDWLYPEMWLEPKYFTYGTNYVNGRIIIGMARGNEILLSIDDATKIFDSRKLECGIQSGAATALHEEILTYSNHQNTRWNEEFHTYTTIWTEDGFTFMVDGHEIGKLDSNSTWLHNTTVKTTAKNAPFDQEFHITLGLGVGGLRVFPDRIISSGYTKPWKNNGAKAMMNFWHAKDQWLPSWQRDDGKNAAFEIDYVKVSSLINPYTPMYDYDFEAFHDHHNNN